MTADPKIYTAAEVRSVGINEEEIDQALAEVTKKAYKEAEHGGYRVIHYSYNLHFLNELARHLRKLGYTTALFERAAGNGYVVVQWDAD